MKKVLFSTTALVLSAGVAFAEAHTGVSVSGSAAIWAEDLGSDVQIQNEIDIEFSASGETDSGLGFGFDYLFTDTDAGNPEVDNWEVYISGSWGKLAVGDPDDALQSVAGLADIGFDGLGVDDLAEVGRGLGSSNGILYSNTLGAVTVYASAGKDISNDDMAVGVKFTTGAVTIGIGYEDTEGTLAAPVDGITAVDVSGSFGAFGYDVIYITHDLGDFYGTILSYDAGMATIDVAFADGDPATGSFDAAYAIGFSSDLGGGAELAGGVGDIGGETVWDLGIGMSF